MQRPKVAICISLSLCVMLNMCALVCICMRVHSSDCQFNLLLVFLLLLDRTTARETKKKKKTFTTEKLFVSKMFVQRPLFSFSFHSFVFSFAVARLLLFLCPLVFAASLCPTLCDHRQLYSIFDHLFCKCSLSTQRATTHTFASTENHPPRIQSYTYFIRSSVFILFCVLNAIRNKGRRRWRRHWCSSEHEWTCRARPIFLEISDQLLCKCVLFVR